MLTGQWPTLINAREDWKASGLPLNRGSSFSSATAVPCQRSRAYLEVLPIVLVLECSQYISSTYLGQALPKGVNRLLSTIRSDHVSLGVYPTKIHQTKDTLGIPRSDVSTADIAVVRDSPSDG